MSVNRCDNPLFFGISDIYVAYILTEIWTFKCDLSKSGLSLPSLTLSMCTSRGRGGGQASSTFLLQKGGRGLQLIHMQTQMSLSYTTDF